MLWIVKAHLFRCKECHTNHLIAHDSFGDNPMEDIELHIPCLLYPNQVHAYKRKDFKEWLGFF